MEASLARDGDEVKAVFALPLHFLHVPEGCIGPSMEFFAIDKIFGQRAFAMAARAHFDKDEQITFAADEVDLTSVYAMIDAHDFIPHTSQMPYGELFTSFPQFLPRRTHVECLGKLD